MLFVDNPVGTGFSYTEKPDGYATDVATVASDMLVLLKHFFTEKAEFQVGQPDASLKNALYPSSEKRESHRTCGIGFILMGLRAS